MYMYDHWLRTLAGEHLIREHVDPKELSLRFSRKMNSVKCKYLFLPPCISAMLATILFYCLSKKFLKKREKMIFIITIP